MLARSTIREINECAYTTKYFYFEDIRIIRAKTVKGKQWLKTIRGTWIQPQGNLIIDDNEIKIVKSEGSDQ